MTARMITISLLLAAAIATAGCAGASQAGSATAPSNPPSSAPPASTPPAAPSSSGTTAPAAAASKPSSQPAAASGIALYHPSTIVSNTAGSTVLRTPDSVAQVSAFYEHDLAAAGWQTVSLNAVGASTNLVVRKGSAGASISITKAGPAETSIAISTYG